MASGRNYSVDGFTKADLSGKLIIKAQLGDDMRCIPIHNEDITYDELVLMMQRVFHGRLTSNDEVTIKYKDEDGDLVTIFDNSDLSFAIHCSKVLKITLLINGQPKPLETEDVKHIRKELQQIRNRVNHLLDCLDPASSPSPVVSDQDGSNGKDGVPSLSTTHFQAVASGSSSSSHALAPVQPAVAAGSGKEFDPLSVVQKESLTSSHIRTVNSVDAGQNFARSSTPDSINSLGSASGPAPYHSQTGQGQGQYVSQGVAQASPMYSHNAAAQVQQDYPVQQGQIQQQQQDYSMQQRTGYAQQQPAKPGFPQQPQQTQPVQAGYAAQPVQASFTQPQQIQAGYSQPQAGYIQQQPVQTGYQQQQVRGGYAPQSTGYAPATPGAAQPVYNTPQPGYAQGVPAQQVQGALNTASPAGATSNPYSRGPASHSGQYPRPHGQYPQSQ